MMRLIKKLGYKTVTEFYQDIADEKLDANNILDKYVEMKRKKRKHSKISPIAVPKHIVFKLLPMTNVQR